MRKPIVLAAGAAATAALSVPVISASAAQPVSAAKAKTKQVKVEDYKFGPKTLSIHHGTKVTWAWVAGTGIPHNVTVVSGPAKFHSKTQSNGSYSHLFTKKGTYKLVCTIHVTLGMKMTVKVS